MLDVTTTDEQLELPPEIAEVLDALPGPAASSPMTADQLAFAIDRPIELIREALWALRDQQLALLHCDERAVARWSRA